VCKEELATLEQSRRSTDESDGHAAARAVTPASDTEEHTHRLR